MWFIKIIKSVIKQNFKKLEYFHTCLLQVPCTCNTFQHNQALYLWEPSTFPQGAALSMPHRCQSVSDSFWVFFCWSQSFLLSFCCFLGGSHLRQEVSTASVGRLYCELFMCSSTSFGVTQITCWPFQYFTMFNDCSVLMMSFCVMLVISLKRKMNR